jgi:hypothetical protein
VGAACWSCVGVGETIFDERLTTDVLNTKTKVPTIADRKAQPQESEWIEVVRKRPVRSGTKTTKVNEKRIVAFSHNQKIIPS